MKKYLFLLVLALGLTGCTQKPTESPKNDVEKEAPIDSNTDKEIDSEEAIDDPSEPDEKEWAGEIEDTLFIEGMEEKKTFRLFSDSDLFLTYVPDDMIVDKTKTEDDETYWFYTNFNGILNKEINMQLYFYPEDQTDRPDVTKDSIMIDIDLESIDQVSAAQYPFAIEEYLSADGRIYLMLGEHNNRFFRITMSSNEEYSEGFYPRANAIIEHIYWTDTNTYLVDQK